MKYRHKEAQNFNSKMLKQRDPGWLSVIELLDQRVLIKKGNKKYGNTLKRVAHLCKQADKAETEMTSIIRC